MSEHPPVIEIRDLSYHFRAGHPIFEGVSVSIEAGDYVGIIGPNGSGKTTFLKLMLGLLPIQTGSVKLFGQPVSQFHDWRKIGYVPQSDFQGDANFPATVREVVAAGHLTGSYFQPRGVLEDLQRSVDQAVDVVGIRHLLRRRIGELSGGEQQRVFIAQALVSDPALLALDEPTAGIDLKTEQSFYALLRKLHQEYGKTILLVSHDLEALAHNAKTALCLNHTVVYHGPADGLHEKRVVEAVFGSHAWHPHQ